MLPQTHSNSPLPSQVLLLHSLNLPSAEQRARALQGAASWHRFTTQLLLLKVKQGL